MSGPTKDELIAEARAARESATLYMLALQDAVEGRIVWIKRAGDYHYGVSRLGAPHGGLFITRFAPGYQAASIQVQYLEHLDRSPRILHTKDDLNRAQAVEAAFVARQKVYDDENEARALGRPL